MEFSILSGIALIVVPCGVTMLSGAYISRIQQRHVLYIWQSILLNSLIPFIAGFSIFGLAGLLSNQPGPWWVPFMFGIALGTIGAVTMFAVEILVLIAVYVLIALSNRAKRHEKWAQAHNLKQMAYRYGRAYGRLREVEHLLNKLQDA